MDQNLSKRKTNHKECLDLGVLNIFGHPTDFSEGSGFGHRVRSDTFHHTFLYNLLNTNINIKC